MKNVRVTRELVNIFENEVNGHWLIFIPFPIEIAVV